jgi:hypothetical protein
MDTHSFQANDMAFPVLDLSQTPNGTHQLGLTKREFFAAMAMQGLLSSPVEVFDKTFTAASAKLAGLAVAHADSLLAELAKETKRVGECPVCHSKIAPGELL